MGVIAIAVAARCRWNNSEGAVEPSTTNRPPATTHIYPAEMDFGAVDIAGGDRNAVDFDSSQLEVGFDFARHDRAGPAVASRLSKSSRDALPRRSCASLFATDVRPAVPLAAYPVRPDAIPVTEGGGIPSWGLLIDNRPRGVFEMHGHIGQADVTELVATWLSGGPFHPKRASSIRQSRLP